MQAPVRGIGAALLAASLFIAPAVLAPSSFTAAQAACMAGETTDSSTADQAKKKMEGAGFTQVRDLKKGCDNVWHGTAMKDGAAVHVALSPQGQVMQEGD